MKKITILGAGSFGTAMAICLESSEVQTVLWGHNKSVLEEIKKYRTNKKYLGDIKLPQINVDYDLVSSVSDADMVLLIVPSQSIRAVAREISPYIKKDAYILSFAKGLELNTHLRLSQVIREEIKDNPIAIVSGPSHAEEVAKRYPTSVVVASDSIEDAEFIQKTLSNPFFRIYRSNDVVGVEMAGVIKNIIALSSGISDGLGYGDNTKALLITRGLVEMSRIGQALGGNKETFQGLAGLGDLVVTATSRHSRNWNFGNKIGQGKTKEEALSEMSMVVEGITATKATYELAKELNIEMPITQQVYSILYEGITPELSVKRLMSRDQKEDGYY